jgi:hemerythrin-like domain-containing protein
MRYIDCEVNDEFVTGSGVVIGAEGSHNDVALRLTFGDMWIGLNIYATFTDAQGSGSAVVMLMPSMLEDGKTMTYIVPIPADAKRYAGKSMLTLSGYSIVNGTQVDKATNTVTAQFRVLKSDYRLLGDDSITPSLAQQLQNSLATHEREITEQVVAISDAVDGAVETAGAAFDASQAAVELVESVKDESTEAARIAEEAKSESEGAKNAADEANTDLNEHKVSTEAHSDIRILISELSARLNAVANSSDTDLDQLSEIVAYIKSNKELIESVTTSKVSVSDIVDNLTTNMGDKPLSARMGVELKRLIDNIQTPDSNVPGWALQPNPPTYTKNDVGLGQVDNVRQYSTQNPPPYPVTSVNGKGGDVTIDETDPTVPAWAKQSTRPEYTNSDVGLGNVANERQYSEKNPPPYPVTSVNGQSGAVSLGAGDVGALPADTKIPKKTSEITNDSGFIKANEAPVQSVNGKSGAVTLAAGDVGARPNTWTPTYSDVGAEKSGAAASAVSGHNTNTAAHNDIRLLIAGLAERLNALANSTDEDLDQMAEIVAYIKANKNLIDQITTGKVNYTDIVNDLATNVANKPLSAAQGVVLKALIDAIVVPTKVSQLTNDSKFLTAIPDEYVTETELAAKKYLTSYTETDPTVPSWAKATNKPSYTKSEVGLGNVDNVKQYSASNPPPYPVTSVNGKTGDVTVTVPTKVSELTNDSKYLTSIPSNYVTDANAEPWTFTFKNGSTVTKKVVLA